MNLFFTLMFGLVYLRMGTDQTSLQDRTGILFFMVMNQAFGSVIGISDIMPNQLRVVSRERASKMYSSASYFAATFLVTLPLELMPSLVTGTIVYYMTALREDFGAYATYLGVMVLTNFVG